jgi:hypothetical protein
VEIVVYIIKFSHGENHAVFCSVSRFAYSLAVIRKLSGRQQPLWINEAARRQLTGLGECKPLV